MPRTEKRFKKWEDRLEEPMLLVTLLVIPTIILEQTAAVGTGELAASILNWFIWVAFLAEFLFMLAISPKRLSYVKSHLLELAIIILTPPFIPEKVNGAQLFRLLRLVRLLRARKLINQIFSPKGLYHAAIFVGLVVLVGGAAFTTVEKDQNLSSWDGFYWALTTVTTIGSDITPKTDLGRVIALTVLFVGTGFVALLTAAFANYFLKSTQSTRQELDELSETEQRILKRLDAIERKLDRKR